ncbi:metalloregulator ArsR/SmtB family transcription factor [Thioclava sp. JM3]|uniref:ArsR/SmtB family transcription factor n=1 Tax=Thioclava sp. JM3 TaxID=1973004 RepID=UPI001F0A6486|nr:metalloregulator ArsR/SmtB family transcription factor [Thioclava sp. JM3]
MALLEEYALVARALSTPARLMLLEQLAQSERRVEALAEKTGLTVANCSQHLQQLRRAGLVTNRRDGKAIIYRLTDARTLTLLGILGDVAERKVGEILHGLSNGEDAPEPINRDELAARLSDGSVTVLDLRPADEFADAHIPGALNMAVTELDKFLTDLDRNTEIVAYCRGPYCVYAHQAVAFLRKNGFNARRLDGGLPEWREDGRAIQATS